MVENVKVHRLLIHVLCVLTYIAVVNKTPVLGHRLYFASVLWNVGLLNVKIVITKLLE